MDETLSMILFSGTDDKLKAAATLASGAAAMGRPVNILLQFWALDAFQADRIRKDHGVSAEAGPEGSEAMRRVEDRGGAHWSELLTQAKQIGNVTINACAHSMEMLELTGDDLDPLVDEVTGIATFVMRAGDGQIVFI